MQHLSPNARGAIFMMLSMAGFVLNDAGMKVASTDLNLFQAILIRGVFATTLMAMLAYYMGAFKLEMGAWETITQPMVLLRTFGEIGGTVFFLTALFHIPLGNVTAVLQLLPLTISLGAALVFGEQVGWRRYTAIAFGFLGVLLIIRPGTDGFNIYALSALAATGFVTLRDLATHRIPKNVPSLFISFVTATSICVLGAIGSLFQTWNPVSADNVAILAGSACILMLGYVCSILTMREGEVSFIAPFRYSILIWALLLGYFVFGEVPDNLALLGAAIITASGLFTFHRERRLLRSQAVPQANSRPIDE